MARSPRVFATGKGDVIEVRVPNPAATVLHHHHHAHRDEAGTVITCICSSKEITGGNGQRMRFRRANRHLGLLTDVSRRHLQPGLGAERLAGLTKAMLNDPKDPGVHCKEIAVAAIEHQIAFMNA